MVCVCWVRGGWGDGRRTSGYDITNMLKTADGFVSSQVVADWSAPTTATGSGSFAFDGAKSVTFTGGATAIPAGGYVGTGGE